MAKIKIDGRIVETAPGGLLTFLVDQKDRPKAKLFLQELKRRELRDGKNPKVETELSVYYRKRTLGQNALIWSLCDILSMEIYGDTSWKEAIYYQLLCAKYSPAVEGKKGVKVPKSGSHCSTVEFSRIIEGAFRELAELGVSMEHSYEIEGYWRKYQEFRYAQDEDPMNCKTVDEYRKRVHSCEACGTYLGEWQTYKGNMAHIKSDGSGGPAEPWNMLHLCTDDHMKVQHQKGWGEFLKMYPHLKSKVDRALKKDVETTQEMPESEKYLDEKNLELY